MTIRNLFNIIIKVIGLLLIKDMIAMVPQLLAAFVYLYDPETFSEGILAIVYSSIIIVVYAIIARYFIFRSENLIDFFRLEKDFDEQTIPLNMHHSSILRIAVIVIGGLMIANGIPELCEGIYAYNQNDRMSHGLIKQNKSGMIMDAVGILTGIVLINFNRQIVNLIELQRKKP